MWNGHQHCQCHTPTQIIGNDPGKATDSDFISWIIDSVSVKGAMSGLLPMWWDDAEHRPAFLEFCSQPNVTVTHDKGSLSSSVSIRVFENHVNSDALQLLQDLVPAQLKAALQIRQCLIGIQHAQPFQSLADQKGAKKAFKNRHEYYYTKPSTKKTSTALLKAHAYNARNTVSKCHAAMHSVYLALDSWVSSNRHQFGDFGHPETHDRWYIGQLGAMRLVLLDVYTDITTCLTELADTEAEIPQDHRLLVEDRFHELLPTHDPDKTTTVALARTQTIQSVHAALELVGQQVEALQGRWHTPLSAWDARQRTIGSELCIDSCSPLPRLAKQCYKQQLIRCCRAFYKLWDCSRGIGEWTGGLTTATESGDSTKGIHVIVASTLDPDDWYQLWQCAPVPQHLNAENEPVNQIFCDSLSEELDDQCLEDEDENLIDADEILNLGHQQATIVNLKQFLFYTMGYSGSFSWCMGCDQQLEDGTVIDAYLPKELCGSCGLCTQMNSYCSTMCQQRDWSVNDHQRICARDRNKL